MSDVITDLPSRATTPTPIIDEDPAQSPMGYPNGKGKNRQRLLRGIERISSSPSLTSLRRARSHSAPYRTNTKSTLSCVSLAATGPPPTPSTARSATPQPSPLGFYTSSSSRPDTPATEFPFPEYNEPESATRKVENGRPGSFKDTAPLPADIKVSRPALQSRTRTTSGLAPRPPFKIWEHMPHEIQIHVFSFLQPKQLVQASRVCKSFHRMCFDGQLWTSLDASEFYQDIPAESLASIISSAGPFIRNLNLRGCVQVEHYQRAEVIVEACKNLENVTLEGCRNFQKTTLQSLLQSNTRLMKLDLTGLTALSNKSCRTIAENCPQLEALNVSWCGKVDSRGIKAVVENCHRLTDLRAGEVRGFDNVELAQALFETNKLTRLVLSGCAELSDESLKIMMHGKDPEIDILTSLPVVPPRKLTHLDLSRCAGLTDAGVKSIGHNTPDLVGLQLSRCASLTDAALEPIIASTPRLTHLELEDLEDLTNSLLSEHLAKAPCATQLEHLSLSYCEGLGDVGMIPLMRACTALRSADLDNTRASDLVLVEAAAMVKKRSTRTMEAGVRPAETLNLIVYDCQNVTWTGIREVLFRNTELEPAPGHPGQVTYPTEVVGLKTFYGFQMTVDEHQKRVKKGDFNAASRLERKWADYMQATEEAGMGGSGHRRRRRRARAAQALHANEEDGLGANGRRRARTMGSCALM